jgi:hypothetical protein
MNGEYDEAENVLHVALRMAQDIDSYDGVTYVYNQLANIAFERVSLRGPHWWIGTLFTLLTGITLASASK